MRDFAITSKTRLNLMLEGLRIRMNKTPEGLAKVLGVPVAQVRDTETDASGLLASDLIETLTGMGVTLIARTSSLGPQPVAPIEEIPELEPVAVPVSEPVSDTAGRRNVYVVNAESIAVALRTEWARSGKPQAQIAEEVGVHPVTFARHIKHGGNVTVGLLGAYADYFNINFVVGRRG